MTTDNQDVKHPICEGCGKEIPGNETVDVWVQRTVFDPETWDPDKTGEPVEPFPGGIGRDYVVFGMCCLRKVRAAWAQFLQDTTVEF